VINEYGAIADECGAWKNVRDCLIMPSFLSKKRNNMRGVQVKSNHGAAKNQVR
jgi:hypothetical protein